MDSFPPMKRPNPLQPDLMTATERRAELCALLAFGLVRLRLREAGTDAEWIGRCTYTDPERFFSYRRSTHLHEADYGRLISVIRL